MADRNDQRTREQRKLLAQLTSEAANAMDVTVLGILPWLMTYGVIDIHMYRAIMAKAENERATYVHMAIMRRGPGSFEYYYWCLIEANFAWIADKMRNLCDLQRYPRLPGIEERKEAAERAAAAAGQHSDRDKKKRIQDISAYAVQGLTANSAMENMLRCLATSELANDSFVLSIKAHRDPNHQAIEVHVAIPAMGPGAYERYYLALIEAGMEHIAALMWDLCDRTHADIQRQNIGLQPPPPPPEAAAAPIADEPRSMHSRPTPLQDNPFEVDNPIQEQGDRAQDGPAQPAVRPVPDRAASQNARGGVQVYTSVDLSPQSLHSGEDQSGLINLQSIDPRRQPPADGARQNPEGRDAPSEDNDRDPNRDGGNHNQGRGDRSFLR